MVVADEVRITGDIGGLTKQRYWTPDGREMLAVPSIRTYVRIKEGKQIGGGTRDANLDKGWLLQKPTRLKPHCSYCNKWHNNQKEIGECGNKKKSFNAEWEKKAKQMKRSESKEIDDIKQEFSELKSEMSDIKNMLAQLLNKK